MVVETPQPVPLGAVRDMLARQRAELLDEWRRDAAALEAESVCRRHASKDRKRAESRLVHMQSEHTLELTATKLAFVSDLRAQETATKDVAQVLRRKEAMTERRDDKIKASEAQLKEELRAHTEAISVLVRGVGNLSASLHAKEGDLAAKDAELEAVVAEAEAVGTQSARWRAR